MTAIAASVYEVGMKEHAMVFGPQSSQGATIKVIRVVPNNSSYTATGVTLDLSTAGPLGANGFKRRLYWCVPMNPACRNATTGYLNIGYEPGTAKDDSIGGFSPADGKYVCSKGETEASTGDYAAYVMFFVACGV